VRYQSWILTHPDFEAKADRWVLDLYQGFYQGKSPSQRRPGPVLRRQYKAVDPARERAQRGTLAGRAGGPSGASTSTIGQGRARAAGA